MDKQIEEIAKIIYKDFQAPSRYIAEQIYNAGYRKIPKNAVVLIDKSDIQQFEWSKLVDKMGIFKLIEKECAMTRKEMAEKFAEKVKEIKIRLDLIGNPYEKKYTQADLKEVANGVLNQFLRYIDEIAKEMEAIYAKYD